MQMRLKHQGQNITVSHFKQTVKPCKSWPVVQLVRHLNLPINSSNRCKQISSATSAISHQPSANNSTFGNGCRLLVATSAAAAGAAAAAPFQMVTCKRCRQRFNPSDNTSSSCRYHPALYSGGEVAKAIGFVRASDAPEHQLEQVVGRRGLMRFWDCCGSEDEQAQGCCCGFHITFDDEVNDLNGWR